jgi:uncharacterized DUF497 family protein
VTFTWDARKALANLKKHGVDFKEAATIFYDPCPPRFLTTAIPKQSSVFLLSEDRYAGSF